MTNGGIAESGSALGVTAFEPTYYLSVITAAEKDWEGRISCPSRGSRGCRVFFFLVTEVNYLNSKSIYKSLHENGL
jgi:hypothetical protein